MEFGYILKHIFVVKFNMEDHMKDRMKENEISNSDLSKNGDIIALMIKIC